MAKARKASGRAAYPGPTVGLEMDPEALLRQLAYGGRTPMLRPRQRLSGLFFARLIDEMAAHHTVLVRTTKTEAGAYKVAKALGRELPEEAFGVHVDFDSRSREWHVLVFHQIPREMRVLRKRDPQGDIWVGPREVARVLKISMDHTRHVIDNSGLEVRRRGGRLERQIRQQDLVILANRPGRWRRRTRKAA
jgi:hypothetical protein